MMLFRCNNVMSIRNTNKDRKTHVYSKYLCWWINNRDSTKHTRSYTISKTLFENPVYWKIYWYYTMLSVKKHQQKKLYLWKPGVSSSKSCREKLPVFVFNFALSLISSIQFIISAVGFQLLFVKNENML